jgi:hypothetical protein
MKISTAGSCLAVAFYVLAGTLGAQAPADTQPLYLNPADTVDNRVQDLISHLTLIAIATLLNHRGALVRFPIRSDGTAADGLLTRMDNRKERRSEKGMLPPLTW